LPVFFQILEERRKGELNTINQASTSEGTTQRANQVFVLQTRKRTVSKGQDKSGVVTGERAIFLSEARIARQSDRNWLMIVVVKLISEKIQRQMSDSSIFA
jgi:hypothetical protein